MSILKAPPKQSKNESLQLRVSAEFKRNLQRYAEFLNATPSYVVIEALDRVFHKDRDFRAWLEQHSENAPAIQPESNLLTEMTAKP